MRPRTWWVLLALQQLLVVGHPPAQWSPVAAAGGGPTRSPLPGLRQGGAETGDAGFFNGQRHTGLQRWPCAFVSGLAGADVMSRRPCPGLCGLRQDDTLLGCPRLLVPGQRSGRLWLHTTSSWPRSGLAGGLADLRAQVQFGLPRSSGLARTRRSDVVATKAQDLDASGWLSSEDDYAGEGHAAGADIAWTTALDARGSPLLLEKGEGPAESSSMEFDSEEADLNIEADEEFEYGWWAPSSQAALPTTLRQDESDLARPNVRDIHITSWRDGEMESELGRLEMALSEERAPTLLQLNGAMHLCCKAVYKGLGQTGLTKALRVLRIMWLTGVPPNARTFDLLLDASVGAAAQGNREALYVALTVVFNSCALGLRPRVILVNQLIKQVTNSSLKIPHSSPLTPRPESCARWACIRASSSSTSSSNTSRTPHSSSLTPHLSLLTPNPQTSSHQACAQVLARLRAGLLGLLCMAIHVASARLTSRALLPGSLTGLFCQAH